MAATASSGGVVLDVDMAMAWDTAHGGFMRDDDDDDGGGGDSSNSVALQQQIATPPSPPHCHQYSEVVLWACQTDSGWTHMSKEVSAALEAAYTRGEDTRYSLGPAEYCTDFRQMRQIRLSTRRVRPIAREIVTVAPTPAPASPDEPDWVTPRLVVNAALWPGLCVHRVEREAVQERYCRETEHFNMAVGQYARLLQRGPAEIPLRVDVFFSPQLRQRFNECKRELAACGAPTTEVWVFHGTKSAVEPIFGEGLRVGGVEVPTRNGSVHGPGVYTAVYPDTARYYGRTVILARALPGAQPGHSKRVKDWYVFGHGAQLLPVYALYF